MKKPTTIVDVARQAGVSKSTVSRAMHGSREISAPTERRIRAIARQMGYRPNMLFSVMGAGNRKPGRGGLLPLAYLYEPPPGKGDGRPWDLPLLETAAQRYGYFVDPYCLRDARSPRTLVRMLHARGYCGVVMGRVYVSHAFVRGLDLSDFTVVCGANTIWEHNFHRVMGDAYYAVQLAWDKAVAAGYRRIGVAHCRHDPELPDDELRLSAALGRQSRDARRVEAIPTFAGRPGDLPAFRAWVAAERPDAVIGFHVAQVHTLRAMGYRVPRDIAFAGLEVLPAGPDYAGVAGIHVQHDVLAECCISVLDQEMRKRIHGIPAHPLSVHVRPQWLDGPSLPMRQQGRRAHP